MKSLFRLTIVSALLENAKLMIFLFKKLSSFNFLINKLLIYEKQEKGHIIGRGFALP